MKSKAVVMGHPLHPMLIPFPFAFLTGSFLFDAAGAAFARPTWSDAGGLLVPVGVVSALVAAVPGLIDYWYEVPPRSTGMQRATKHMIANLTAVALFAVAWVIRRGSPERMLFVLTLEAAGAALLVYAGWMGGTLVSRNQISVDHRYAGAGKWQEERLDGRRAGAIVVGRTDALRINQMKLLRIGERRIVLARSERGYEAFDDRCTHRGGSLADGVMICGTVQCPWHGSQFDVRTGQVKAGPARDPIETYQIEEADGEVRLRLNDSSNQPR